jgi:CRISPR system Cascade subunit CasD
MQSWGVQSRFSVRDTGLEPSKSGVIGLLCAALGRRRDEDVSDLVALRMGVRVDREGILKVDYQTAGGTHGRSQSYGVAKASGATPDTVQSLRYYLADASFLVGLQGEDMDLLHRLNAALAAPVWQLSLGRKSYVPAEPVRLPDLPPFGPGLQDLPLYDALERYIWPDRSNDPRGGPPDRLRLVIDAEEEAGAEVRRDVPISFAARTFGLRRVQIKFLVQSKEPPDVSVTVSSESA